MNQDAFTDRNWLALLVLCGVVISANGLLGADGQAHGVEGEWERLLAAKKDFEATEPPPPTLKPDELERFLAEFSVKTGELADGFRKYQQRADVPHRSEAWYEWMELLSIAAQWNSNRRTELELAERDHLADPELSVRQRLTIRGNQIDRISDMRERETLVRQVREEMDRIQNDLPPGDPGRNFRFVFENHLVQIAAQSEAGQARRLVSEIMHELSPGHPDFEAAKRLKEQLERVGQKLTLRFADLGGETVELTNYIGKVVLLDFWATWCPPCIAGIPKVDSLWNTLRQEGFEVIGISYDSERGVLERFLKKNELKWPQFFNEEGQNAPLVRSLGQPGPPAYWLIDRQGVLVDLNAFNDLEEKVRRLIRTKAPATVETVIDR